MNILKEIQNFESVELNTERMEYYLRYFSEYYHDRFRFGQGTEVILDILKRHGKSGHWMDVGSGPATLFWGLMLDGVAELHCTEIFVEGLKVLDAFMVSRDVPQCYRDVMDMYKVPATKLQLLRTIPKKYFLFDALRPWPVELGHASYDLISAFGVFGLSKTAEEYRENFGFMRPYLKTGGMAIGANWVRSQHFINQDNTDNRYLSSSLVEQAAKYFGYELLHTSEEIIQGDPNYDKVIVWALRNS